MLIKQVFSGPDYECSLKRRRLVGFALLAVGLVGIVCYFFLLDGSDLPDFARGFYSGAASGCCLGSAVLLARTTHLLHDSDARKKARIRETDERQKAIIDKAFRVAGLVTFFISAAALFVVLPFSRLAFSALLGAMLLYMLAFWVSTRVLERRM